jgi:hypothetical protein
MIEGIAFSIFKNLLFDLNEMWREYAIKFIIG